MSQKNLNEEELKQKANEIMAEQNLIMTQMLLRMTKKRPNENELKENSKKQKTMSNEEKLEFIKRARIIVPSDFAQIVNDVLNDKLTIEHYDFVMENSSTELWTIKLI